MHSNCRNTLKGSGCTLRIQPNLSLKRRRRRLAPYFLVKVQNGPHALPQQNASSAESSDAIALLAMTCVLSSLSAVMIAAPALIPS